MKIYIYIFDYQYIYIYIIVYLFFFICFYSYDILKFFLVTGYNYIKPVMYISISLSSLIQLPLTLL